MTAVAHDGSMQIRVAAYAVVVREDGRMLLPHWSEGDRGGWTLPGGGIDPGEDPAAAAVREVREETGYDVELDGLLGVDGRVLGAADRVRPRGRARRPSGASGGAVANFSPPTASLVWLGLILVLWCVGCAPRES